MAKTRGGGVNCFQNIFTKHCLERNFNNYSRKTIQKTNIENKQKLVSEIQPVEITIQSIVYDNGKYKQLMREVIERITLRVYTGSLNHRATSSPQPNH